MATALEERVAVLEAPVQELEKATVAHEEKPETPWWEKIRGTFKDDPTYDEATALGRAYRESLRPTADEDANSSAESI